MKTKSLRDSIIFRMIIVAVLGMVLQIPISMVAGLIGERARTRDSAVREVTEKWGRQQTIAGPILSVPIKHTSKTTDGNIYTRIEYAHFLPSSLTLNAELAPEIRNRGIYRIVLYNAQLKVDADFPKPLLTGNMVSDGEVLWKEAFITFGVSDLKGIRTISNATCGDQVLTPEPGLITQDLVQSGFSFRLPFTPDEKPLHFSLDANINGSEELKITPLGKQTSVTARSAWGNPSFIGDFLPEKREITDSSFSASWNVLHLNRNLPQVWAGRRPDLDKSSFGVKLIIPVDEYQKSARAVKYAIMFIALTFLAFTIIDVLTESPFHPIHYTLAGLALILFFVLLLSLSEHLSFNVSYLMAGVAVVLIISLYTLGVTRRGWIGAAVAGVLGVLYGFLFVLLQLEDYALLLGSVGLSASLALVMYLTRRIDWFGVAEPKGMDHALIGLPEQPAER